MPSNPVSKIPFCNILTGPGAARHGILPKVQLPGEGVLQRAFNEELGPLLRNSGLFRRGILPVIPLDGRLVEMLPPKFITWATKYVVPFRTRIDRRGIATDHIQDMTEQHARIALADTDFIMFMPIISRIRPSPVPIINDAGFLILCTPGYDPSSGTFVFEGFLQPKPPDPAKPPIPNLLPSGGYFDDSMTEMFTAENNSVLFITSNNVSVGSDIGHRTLWCELFCEEADPQARVIDGPILDDVWLNNTANRYRILSALWAIIRHWDHAGRPLATGKPRLGFEIWGSLIGGMVEFAGFGDMLATPKLDNAGATEADHIASLVRHLWKTPASDYTYQQIVHCCWEEGWFPWNLHGREEAAALRYGDPATMTIKLNDQCSSRMGLLLRRHSGERGSVHTIRPDQQGKAVKVRFSSHGEGRAKRFRVSLA